MNAICITSEPKQLQSYRQRHDAENNNCDKNFLNCAKLLLPNLSEVILNNKLDNIVTSDFDIGHFESEFTIVIFIHDDEDDLMWFKN